MWLLCHDNRKDIVPVCVEWNARPYHDPTFTWQANKETEKKKGGQTVEEKSGIIRICPQLKNKKRATKQNKIKQKKKKRGNDK